ncbi:hypothetical protein ACI65C_005486 [Semiaphis heraclei]
MMTSIVEAVHVYNLESNSNGAAIKVLEDGNFAIAISTPLMQRVSCGLDCLEECGEMLFIDTSGNIDRYGCNVFVIYTNSCAGGLPIGTIILTSESSSVIIEGLQLWKNLFPKDALSKRGEIGPKIFMSDDSAAERHALHDVFPQSTLLLCIFHVLQATWGYLWNSSHGVPLCHRQVLYSKVKEMLYSKSKDQLESTFNNILHEPCSDKAYFLPAIKSFVKSMENNVKTHAGLCSAMETFGKYSGLNPKVKNPKLIGNKRIGTQLTARARRTTQIGGRKNLTAGRTPKWRRVPEHGYTNKISSSRLPQKKHKSFDPTQLPENMIKTPHSLTRCVEINKALGSTHYVFKVIIIK